MMSDDHQLLNLKPGADADAIKTAYRRLAKTHHPDHNPDPQAHRRFRLATDAYRRLMAGTEPPPRAARPNDLPLGEQWRLLLAEWRRMLARLDEPALDEKVRGLPRRVWAAALLGCGQTATEPLFAELDRQQSEPPPPATLLGDRVERLRTHLKLFALTTRRGGRKMNGDS